MISHLYDSGVLPTFYSSSFKHKCNNPKLNAYFVKVFAQPFLTDKEFDKGYKELDSLTSSFPSDMEELEQPQRKGISI